LFIAIGPVLLVSGIVGLLVTWRSAVFTKMLSAMMFGYILLVIFPVRHMMYRYIMIPAFFFAFFIARAFAMGLHKQQKWLMWSTFTLMLIGFGWVGLRAVDLTYQMVFDSRYEASRWIEQNAEAGDKIAFFSDQNILPPLEKKVTAIKLMDNPAPIERLKKERIRFVLVQPDWTSKIGDEHSRFFPKAIYEQISNGSLGYRETASFQTVPLFRGLFLDLPLVTPGYIVNPPLKIYELIAVEKKGLVLK
jgi:hypothetical protein